MRHVPLFYFLLVETEHSGSPPPANRCLKPTGRGRPGRKPINRLQKSFLIEKGVTGAQLKKELTLGGRINVNDLDGGLWMNPSVVLRRLTVTIGGFKIELLPGPSYTQTVEASQAAYLDDGVTYGSDVGFDVLSADAITVTSAIPENVAEVEVKENSSADDPALAPGPYVNPNDVQSSNGTLTESPSVQEAKVENQSACVKEKPVSKEKDDKPPQSNENNVKNVSSKTDDKLKREIGVKSPLKSNKSKELVSGKPNNTVKGQKESHDMPSPVIQREDVHKMKSVKEKKDISPLKRPAENTQSEHANKMQKVQISGDGKMKPKLPSPPRSSAKKIPPLGNRVDQQGPSKQIHPCNSSKAESVHMTHNRQGQPVKTADEGGQDKPKVKKPEKIFQRQKSKSSRSISVDEPQLFIPDNAPVVKKETSEEQPANSETVWDGNNCCGLCKKHHNNM